MGVKERRAAERRKRRRLLVMAASAPVVIAAVIAVAIVVSRVDLPPDVESHPLATATKGTDGELGFKVGHSRCGIDNVITSDQRIAAAGQFCGIELKVTNKSEGLAVLDLSCQSLIGTSNRRYDIDLDATRASNQEPISERMPVADKLTVDLHFDIPGSDRAKELELHSPCHSDGLLLGVPLG